MKIIIALLAASYLILNSGHSFGKNLSELNGYDWDEFGQQEKNGFVIGFCSASNRQVAGAMAYAKITKQRLRDTNDKGLSWDILANLESKDKEGFEGVSSKQIARGIDYIYSDHRNKMILIEDAIYVSYKQSKGETEDNIARIILFLRAGGYKDFGNALDILTIKKDGKIEKILSFP